MDLRLRSGLRGHTIDSSREDAYPGYSCVSTFKETGMTWEKPQAVDMRWGFEITMYIANR